MDATPQVPSPQERAAAAVSHLAVLFTGPGLLAPLLVWNGMRGKSRFAGFQALQALGFQTLQGLVTALVLLVFLAVGGVWFAVITLTAPEQISTAGLYALGIPLGLAGVLMLAYTLLGVAAAAACALGKDFRYPWLGARLAAFLRPAEGWDEDHEDRWVAANAHLSVMIPFYGLLVPLLAWAFQKERRWLRFHALQTLVYQLAGLVISAALLAAQIAAVAFPLLLILPESGAFSDLPAATYRMALIPFFIVVGLVALAILVYPIYGTLPLVAAYRLVRGGDYHYPWIGKRIHARMLSSDPNSDE